MKISRSVPNEDAPLARETIVAKIKRQKEMEASSGRKPNFDGDSRKNVAVEPPLFRNPPCTAKESWKGAGTKARSSTVWEDEDELSAVYDGNDDSYRERKCEMEIRAQIPPENTVLYFACKDESFQLRKDFKVLSRKLKKLYGLTVLQLQEEIGAEGTLPACALVILAGLRKPMVLRELSLLTDFVEGGGRVLVLAEANSNAEIYNAFTERFGVTVMKDTVVRTDRFKQYHPKECFVADAMICPTLMKEEEEGLPENFSLLYPHGCSLEVCKGAKPLISSGLSSYPTGRPLGAIFTSKKSNGKLVALGSGHLFSDKYIESEDNPKLLAFLIELLLASEDLVLHAVDIDDSHLKDYDVAHETVSKSKAFRGVLQDTDEFIFPGSANTMGVIEPKKLVSSVLTHADYSLLPDLFQAYDQLNLDRKLLSRFIQPQFEMPFPKPKLSLFPPKFRDLQGPPLELFDLDEEFSSAETRMGRIVNKCSEEDLEYCATTLGTILNVRVKSESFAEKDKAKAAIFAMASELAKFKNGFNSAQPSDVEEFSDEDDSMKSSLNEPIIIPVPFVRSGSRRS